MSQYDQQIPVAYPPSSQAMGLGQAPPPPLGYPTSKDAQPQAAPAPTKFDTQSRGDGFLKGCCAAICCCCVLDACF